MFPRWEGKLMNCNSAFLSGCTDFQSKEDALNHSTVFLYSQPEEREQFLIDLGRQGKGAELRMHAAAPGRHPVLDTGSAPTIATDGFRQ